MKRPLCTILIVGVFVAIAHDALSACQAPDGMMIEFLQGSTVTGITDTTPEFGWIVHSSCKHDRQSAYHILVSSDPKTLGNNKGDMWDSQKQVAATSINVSYGGKQLVSNTAYFWKLKTWCRLGGESAWSNTMKFTTGNVISNEYVTTRYPLRATALPPSKIIKKSEGHYLIDFGKVAFGYLQVELEAPQDNHLLEVHLGERGDAQGVNKKPSGTVRYHKVMQTLKKGLNKLDIHPQQDKRNTGGNAIKLPKAFGSITPFRYVELVNCPAGLKASMI